MAPVTYASAPADPSAAQLSRLSVAPARPLKAPSCLGLHLHRSGAAEAEFDAYLKCGRLEVGFLRLRCEQCYAEKLVAFS